MTLTAVKAVRKEFTMTKADLLKIIRAKCMDCTCEQIKEVTRCHIRDCPLWPVRLGKDPDKPKRTLTEEHKKKLVAGREKAITRKAAENR